MRKPPPTRRSAPTHAQVLAWLDARVNYERIPAPGNTASTFSLARMRRLLVMLGNPHRRFAVAHAAGTKGKGSTVTMLASILERSGHRVGRYLSPHVHTVEERIAVNGRSISQRDFTAAFAKVIPAVDSLDHESHRLGRRGPTWFEAMTAAAFVHFAEMEIEIAVLETGLGGRLDATNVCHPLVTIITSISLDHTKLLGRTVAAIATEKAGIIKRHCPVICGVTQPSARRAIEAVASRRRAPLIQLGRDFVVANAAISWGTHPSASTSFELSFPAGSSPLRLTVGLAGRHQAVNAALAVVAARHLRARGFAVTDDAIARALATTRLPARIETVRQEPTVIVDAAHNVASMASLIETVAPCLASRHPRALVFAASQDKQAERMLRTVAGHFDHVFITRYVRNPRAMAMERLQAACVAAGLPAPVAVDTPAEAVEAATSRVGPGGIVVVAGSFFLAAEVGITAGTTQRTKADREHRIDIPGKTRRARAGDGHRADRIPHAPPRRNSGE